MYLITTIHWDMNRCIICRVHNSKLLINFKANHWFDMATAKIRDVTVVVHKDVNKEPRPLFSFLVFPSWLSVSQSSYVSVRHIIN